ncbi:hypothetical protein BDN70DRAFT_883408 [Pholiota conissans]|uniref:Uncharacterized protein n=1 Tax=Pholiota conissans TaxID=109636 RepID=A0A9P5YV58_9AGAR|nr:hypothetical protein BDN70DRAFT_883408 [Pholiota conissans]
MRWTYSLLFIVNILLLAVHETTASAIDLTVPDSRRILKREPLPARTSRKNIHSPKKRHRSRSPSPRHASVPLPRTPHAGPSNNSAQLLRTPSPRPASHAGSSPTSSNDSPGKPSPKKQRKKRFPKSNIHAEDLKTTDYRALTLKENKIPLDSNIKYDADHILEPQIVTYYLNNYRGS